MDARLQALVNLNEVFIEKIKMEKILKDNPEKIIKLSEEHEKVIKEYEDLKESFKKVEMEKHKSEMDVKALEEDIIKKQGQLMGVKTNKEYKALENEIKNSKDKISSLEDKILEALDKEENSKTKIEEASKKVQEEKNKFEEAKAQLEKELEQAKATIDSLADKVKEMEQHVDKSYLRQFRLVASKGYDLPLVPANSGSCGGCKATLPPRMMQIIQNGLTLVNCECCSRLLYWDETDEELQE